MRVSRWFAAGLAAMFAAAAFDGAAQDPLGAPPPPEVLPEVRPLVDPIGPFDVQDMPLAEFCRELQARLGGSVVIFVDEDVADRPLSLSIQDINTYSVINLLQSVANVEVTWSSARGFMPVRELYRLDPDTFAQVMPGGGPILLRVANADGPAQVTPSPGAPKAGVSTRVYNIANILRVGAVSVADIATAVETAWPEDDPSLQLRVHEDTGLLICRGDADAIDVVDQILFQLEGGEEVVSASMQLRRGDVIQPQMREGARRVEELQMALEAARRALDEREAQTRDLTEHMEMELRTRAEALARTQMEMANARQQWELESKGQMMDRELEYRAERTELVTQIRLLEEETKRLRQHADEAEARSRDLQNQLPQRP